MASVESGQLIVNLDEVNGQWDILHKPAGQRWAGPQGRLCRLRLESTHQEPISGFQTERCILDVDRVEDVRVEGDTIRCLYSAYDRIMTGRTSLRIEFVFALDSRDDVVLGYRVLQEDRDWTVHSVNIVDDALPITGTASFAVLPAYQGEVVPVGSHFSYLPQDRNVSIRTSDVAGTYTGVNTWSMAMFALVSGDSAAVVTWEDPDVEAGVRGDDKAEGEWQIRSTVVLNREAREVRLHFMRDAGYVEVAKYYREVAKRRGLFDTLKQKIERNPEVEKNVGALRFTVAPKWGRSKGGGWVTFIEEGESRIDYTFDEVAEVTEHLARDLGIERGQTLVKAWTRRGYDMDYPDILPAAEECGGNDGLARASERVRRLGWEFGLHDNSMILFADAPSTDPEDSLVRVDGTKVEGGLGGRWRMYTCCPARTMRYAERSYPQLRDLFQLNLMYSDQIAALPLVECFSPSHPMTRRQSIEAYRALIRYKRSFVHVVTSEVADEWAVPIFDAMGISTDNAHKFAYPIPLFELVFRECVNLESWPWGSMSVRDVVNCISRGRMVYITFPNHDYREVGFDTEPTADPWSSWWRNFHTHDNPFLRGDQGWGEGLDQYDRLVKNVYEVTSPLNLLTAHAEMTGHTHLDSERTAEMVTFDNEFRIVVNRGDSDFDHRGTVLPKLGFLAEGPGFLAFYARRRGGIEYPDGALFAARSLDGLPLAESGEVRVYHGFGEPRIDIAGQVFEVARETVVSPRGR